MILQKWNYETHKYEEHLVPTGSRVVLYSPNMELMVDCANCLRPLKMGDTYTSKTIHSEAGFGFPVCEHCYAEERADEEESKKKRNTP